MFTQLFELKLSMPRIALIAAFTIFTSTLFTSAKGSATEYDVVVYGGTSAGITAAIQASRLGKSVILLEPSKYLGGLSTSGLGYTDTGNKQAIGGLSREFYQRIKKSYDNPELWKYEKSDEYGRYDAKLDAMWTFEPHIAMRVFQEMLDESSVEVRLQQPLDRSSGVTVSENRIKSIRTLPGLTVQGKMFIDTTYEGDLMAAAGVSYTVGRESNEQYGETLNGVQTALNIHNHRFPKPVDPYRTPGDPSSGLLPGIHPGPPGDEGQADHRVQAYCFRMCMTNVDENRVPFEKPANYDPLRYELLLRNFEAGDLRVPYHSLMMPNGKTDTNNNGAFSTDNIGMNYDYPEASYERRAEIVAEHLDYQKGLMWTLANHPRVPKEVRDEVSKWGLSRDEFTDTDHWPHTLYIREARRMIGEYVTTEADCFRRRIVPDSVGMGSYNMDSHNTQRYVSSDGLAKNEGDVQVSPGGTYLISYRSIVPKRDEVENLLVPVCLSSSHIAYGSIRMEPVFMILGQSAASAASLSLDNNIAVQDLPYATLRKQLDKDGQALDLIKSD